MKPSGDNTAHRLFRINDKGSGSVFLVDTGAQVSVTPPTAEDRRKGPVDGMILQAANGSNIKTFGYKLLTLELGLRRQFKWVFIVADVKQNILGADFLYNFNILVDVRNKQLIDNLTSLKSSGICISKRETVPQNISIVLNHLPQYNDLLKKYQSVLQPDFKKELNRKVL